MTFYIQPHMTQFDGGLRQGEACVPAALANGVGASTGGARRPTSAAVHALIPKSQETSSGPGWSVVDADRAMAKLNISFTIGPATWEALEAAHNAKQYLIVQGDSDRFANSTCSGAFDGDHCIGVSPNETTFNGIEYWYINDPICKTGRWEKKSVIRAYAADYAARVGGFRWGKFNTVVPTTGTVPKPPAVTLKYGGVASHGSKRIAVPSGRKANVRTRPTTTAGLVPGRSGGPLAGGPNRLSNRTLTEYWQVTRRGQSLSGSSTWYGDRTGTRWVHSSAF